MANLTYDIASLLQSNGYGTIGVDIFVSQDTPSKPDVVINIVNSGTFGPDIQTIPPQTIERILCQIVCREQRGGGQLCEEKIYSIKNFMRTVRNEYLNLTLYLGILHYSGPVDIGIDSIMRPSYSLNMLCYRTYTPS